VVILWHIIDTYDIDDGTPRAILEANGNFEEIQPFKNFPPASSMVRGRQAKF